jgi:FHA domain-containing protein
MNLVIRALTLDNHPLSEALTGSFGAAGGTLGRADGNTIALPDPERHISRLQAEVLVEAGAYLIRNAGTANPIVLNGRALAPGERAPLADRDELQIGGYVLGVQLGDDDDARRITKPRPAAARIEVATPIAAPIEERPRPPAPVATDSNPFADLLTPGSSGSGAVDPFAFLDTPSRAAAPRPIAVERPAAAAAAKLPDDFDPFADIMGVPAPAPLTSATDLLGSIGAGSAPGPSLDDAFGLSGAADPLAAFMGGATATAPDGSAGFGVDRSTDPLAMFASGDATPGALGAEIPAAFNHTAELAGAYSPPRVLPEVPPQAPQVLAQAPPAPSRALPDPPPRMPSAAPPSAAAPTGSDPLWSAFCEGVGIRMDLPQGLTPQQMQLIGQVLREAIDGSLRLMSVRATTKQELRAQVTTIRSRNNNPLKFAPDAQLAAQQLLQPPLRGFMAGPAAMQDAMHDLVGHSIGTMAGMRAALAGVLGRFEPQALEAKLSARSMLDSLLPMNRKAKLWDLYLQHFESIRSDAHDDFHTLFGKAFVAAYEDELDRLPRASPE